MDKALDVLIEEEIEYMQTSKCITKKDCEAIIKLIRDMHERTKELENLVIEQSTFIDKQALLIDKGKEFSGMLEDAILRLRIAREENARLRNTNH